MFKLTIGLTVLKPSRSDAKRVGTNKQRMRYTAAHSRLMIRCCNTCHRWVGSTSNWSAITSGAAVPRSSKEIQAATTV